MANGEEPPREARKRPEVAIRPPLAAPGIVCSYTCGFTAQPPGTPGYSHSFRLWMAATASTGSAIAPNES